MEILASKNSVRRDRQMKARYATSILPPPGQRTCANTVLPTSVLHCGICFACWQDCCRCCCCNWVIGACWVPGKEEDWEWSCEGSGNLHLKGGWEALWEAEKAGCGLCFVCV
jgi:hypothetical protein